VLHSIQTLGAPSFILGITLGINYHDVDWFKHPKWPQRYGVTLALLVILALGLTVEVMNMSRILIHWRVRGWLESPNPLACSIGLCESWFASRTLNLTLDCTEDSALSRGAVVQADHSTLCFFHHDMWLHYTIYALLYTP
jgi:hypothetical protein